MYIPNKVIGLDFETYYDAEYTLKKMSTTAYIRDPRFLVFGVGIRTNRQAKTKWYRGFQRAYDALHKFDWSKTASLAHNAHFEGLILNHHFNIQPAYYYDTVSMGRALYGMETRAGLDVLARYLDLGQKVEGYLTDVKGIRNPSRAAISKLAAGCRRDVDLMWAIFRRMLSMYPESELDLIHHTIRCYAQPVIQIDKALALKEHKREVARRRKVVRKAFMHPGERLTREKLADFIKQLRSRETFAGKLRKLNVDPPLKVSTSDESKLTYAFAKNDLEFLALLEHPVEEVRNLVEAKTIASSSIHETRPLRFIEHADPAFPVYLNYAGAKNTHRWSGGDRANPQNQSREGQLRHALVAPKGYKFVIGDSAAIEARVNGYLAGQDDLIQQFADYDKTINAGRPDATKEPYCIFASDLFHKKITKADKLYRFIGKVCILALGYQMSGTRFRFTLETGTLGPRIVLDHHLYQEYVDKYRIKMHAIRDQWYFFGDRLRDMLYKNCNIDYRNCITFQHRSIIPPNELPLKYPNLRWDDEQKQYIYREKTKIYGAKCLENVTQNLARTLVAEQLARVAENNRLVLMVHDEGVYCVKTRSANRVAQELLESLRTPPTWAPDIPLNGEVGIFDHYVKM